MERETINKDFRVNEQILRGPAATRVRDVRLIDDENQALGVMSARDALAMAQEKGLDLIEVAPDCPAACLPHHGLRQVQIRTGQARPRTAEKAASAGTQRH